MLGNLTRKKNNKGFTLIEIMIAIFLIGVALVGALAFFNSSLTSGFDTKNELIAAGLAQEGAELVRNKVDFEKLNKTSWSGIVSMLNGVACTRIDHTSLLNSHSCFTDSVSKNICFSSGRYQQCPGGTDTGMTRTLTISHLSDVANGDRLVIEVDVKWNSDSRTTTANDIIYGNSY